MTRQNSPASGVPTGLPSNMTVVQPRNNDGILDLGDAVTSLDIIFFGLPAACKDASDWNDDGRVDISDPIATLGYIFGGTAAPAAPFPLCGTDPIFDSLDCTGASNCP